MFCWNTLNSAFLERKARKKKLANAIQKDKKKPSEKASYIRCSIISISANAWGKILGRSISLIRSTYAWHKTPGFSSKVCKYLGSLPPDIRKAGGRIAWSSRRGPFRETQFAVLSKSSLGTSWSFHKNQDKEKTQIEGARSERPRKICLVYKFNAAKWCHQVHHFIILTYAILRDRIAMTCGYAWKCGTLYGTKRVIEDLHSDIFERPEKNLRSIANFRSRTMLRELTVGKL